MENGSAAAYMSDTVSAFTGANQGLPAGGVQLLLSGSELSEVHVCYDQQFKFRKCDTSSSVNPTKQVRIRKIGG